MFELFTDLKKILPLITQRDRWKFLVLLVLMIVASIMEAIGIGVVPAFVTLVMKPSALAENRWVGEWFVGMPEQITLKILIWASIGLFVFVVLKNIFLTFVYYIQSRIVASQRVKIADRMFKIYQSAPYEWHLQRSTSDFLRSIQNDTAQVLSGVVLPLLGLIMAIIMTVVIVIVLVLSTPGVTVLALVVTGAGLLLVIRMLQKRLRLTGMVSWVEYREQAKAIQQGFGGLVDARISGCEEYLSKSHKRSLQRLAASQLQQQTVQRATPYAVEAFAILGLLVILFLLVSGSDSLASSLPVIALLAVVMVRLKQVASQIASSINQMNIARAFIPAIVEDLNELEAIEAKRQAVQSHTQLISHFEKLELENVTYSYPNTQDPVTRDISLELKRGESIAFVGETGCGKSTLVNVILGLLEPQSGYVRVNDIEIERDLTGWRAQLGYIPQSVYLIDDTIAANVAFGVEKSEVDENQLWKAISSACLADYVNALPEGLETVIGEAGVRLSGGQRQRLGIARALYQDPGVLVMDEATSALDNKTEEKVMKATQNLKRDRTLIMIAHRLSTVEDCDRLYLMREGAIEAVGSFAELKKDSVLFGEMLKGHDTRQT